MIKISLYSFFIFILGFGAEIHAGEFVDGVYLGWKKSVDLTPENIEEIRYQQHELVMKDSIVRIRTSPKTIKNGELSHSASENGFFYYQGKISYRDGKPYIRLKLTDCDYCRSLDKESDQAKEFPVIIKNEVMFSINSVLYVLRYSQ